MLQVDAEAPLGQPPERGGHGRAKEGVAELHVQAGEVLQHHRHHHQTQQGPQVGQEVRLLPGQEFADGTPDDQREKDHHEEQADHQEGHLAQQVVLAGLAVLLDAQAEDVGEAGVQLADAPVAAEEQHDPGEAHAADLLAVGHSVIDQLAGEVGHDLLQCPQGSWTVGAASQDGAQQFEQQRGERHQADDDPEAQARGIAQAVVLVVLAEHFSDEGTRPPHHRHRPGEFMPQVHGDPPGPFPSRLQRGPGAQGLLDHPRTAQDAGAACTSARPGPVRRRR